VGDHDPDDRLDRDGTKTADEESGLNGVKKMTKQARKKSQKKQPRKKRMSTGGVGESRKGIRQRTQIPARSRGGEEKRRAGEKGKTEREKKSFVNDRSAVEAPPR